MSTKHVIKHTETEILFKCYITDNQGGNIDISLEDDCTKSTQVYVAPSSVPDESGGGFVDTYSGSHVFITGIWWGLKKDKQLDVTRIVNSVGPVLHGHYYLINGGFYDFNHGGFADRVYATQDIRMIFDGPGHCLIRLRKAGWNPKVETATFSIYDDPTAVGS